MNYPIDRIVFKVEGQNHPPILFLHGWGGDEQTMMTLSKPFSNQRKTIRLALPGFGNSPEPAEPWGSMEFAKTVIEWVEKEGFQKIDLIGHSHGGRVAIQIAALRPDMVNNLALISSAGLPPRRNLQVKMKLNYGKALKLIAKWIGGKFARRIEERRQKMGSEDWKAASPLMKATLSRVIPEDLTTKLSMIQARTVLVWGENDSATPKWMGEKMNLLIPNSQLHILQGAGHYVFLDRTGDVVSILWNHFGLQKVW